MTIQLPEDLERFVQAKTRSGGFASEDDFVVQTLRRLQREESWAGPKAEPQSPPSIPVWERVMQIMGEVPDSVIDKIPTDGSVQHDHYIYGTPKRPVS